VSGLLDGKNAIVTGIGPGLGQAIAKALAREGAAVALAARSQDFLDQLAGEIAADGGRAVAVPTNVADADQCARLAEVAASELGGIDVVVNSAFRMDSGQPFADADLAKWRKIYDVNLFGSLQVTQAAVPFLREGGGGSVVFIASMSARRARGGEGGYASSKGALLTAAKTLAVELGGDHIRVNSVVPGWIWGPNVQLYVDWQVQERGVTADEAIAEITGRIPLGEIPPQEDVANAVVFFASDLARCITGQALDVNGGEWAP